LHESVEGNAEKRLELLGFWILSLITGTNNIQMGEQRGYIETSDYLEDFTHEPVICIIASSLIHDNDHNGPQTRFSAHPMSKSQGTQMSHI